MRIVKLIFIILVIIYLIASSIYIINKIDYNYDHRDPFEAVGMGFSRSDNILRLFMGIPRTTTTYGGVSPSFWIEVIIKLVFAVLLMIYAIKLFKKHNK